MDYTIRIVDKLLRFDTTQDDVLVTMLPFKQTPNAPYEIQKTTAGDGHTVTVRVDPSTTDFLLPGGTRSILLDDTNSTVMIRVPANGLSPAFVSMSGGGGGNGGGGGDVIGPVSGFTSAREVGARYAGDQDRLVHLTVGFVPICPVPQPVTYLVSSDNGATWVWVGSQRMQAVGQQLLVDRLAPSATSLWKVACVAGNLGGDPTPILDANLDGLYEGVARSASFSVAGLETPLPGLGITATIGVCSNVISADGFTQYGRIPGVIYTDPVASTAFFVRISVQILDAARQPLAGEQAYGGTQITGTQHTENALLITYVPGLAYVRYRFYVANRNSQGSNDFTDPTTNTLQNVSYNGSATLADHYDVPITIPPFTPINPDDAFNVTSVTASEVGPKYQDVESGLHTTVGIVPVIDHDYSSPRTVTVWLYFGKQTPVWQGWYSLTAPGQIIRIGDSTLSTQGTRESGGVWVPMNTTEGNWICYCGAGRLDSGVDPTKYATVHFTVPPVSACSPTGTTAASFVPDPATNDPIIYNLYDPGIWRWEYYELTWVPPSVSVDPNIWFVLITVQKGATVNGVWKPAPDKEGINSDPTGQFLGRVHDEIRQLPGLKSDQTAVMSKYGASPATWDIPPAENPDGSPNI